MSSFLGAKLGSCTGSSVFCSIALSVISSVPYSDGIVDASVGCRSVLTSTGFSFSSSGTCSGC